MKKVILSTALVLFGMVGAANANLFYEEYTGFQGVHEGESYNFGFDMWYTNDVEPVDTDSALTLTQDAEGAFGPWDSAKLIVDLWSEDSAKEKAKFVFTAFNSADDGSDDEMFNLGFKEFNGEDTPFTSQVAQFNYDFTDLQLAAFEGWGWGNVKIKAVSYGAVNNDFAIERVAMLVNAPIPEPSTMLLFGAGLLGLVGYSRKRSNK